MKLLLALFFAITAMSAAHSASEKQMINESKQAVKVFAGQLKAELMAGMAKGGPPQALTVCNTAAEVIARNNSEKNGWTISRTSLKPRNTKNAPDEWEAVVLKTFDKRKEAGNPIGEIEYSEIISSNSQPEFRYMKAISTKPLCLICHGENISPDLAEKIDQLYPDDRAKGYKIGDIRGAFSVIRDVE